MLPCPPPLGVDHDVGDERVVTGLRERRLDEAALRGGSPSRTEPSHRHVSLGTECAARSDRRRGPVPPGRDTRHALPADGNAAGRAVGDCSSSRPGVSRRDWTSSDLQNDHAFEDCPVLYPPHIARHAAKQEPGPSMTINVSPPATLDPLPARSLSGVRAPYQELAPAPSSGPDFGDIVDEWGEQSFPASDPPSNW
jgi:hypothetical protein